MLICKGCGNNGKNVLSHDGYCHCLQGINLRLSQGQTRFTITFPQPSDEDMVELDKILEIER